MMSVPLVRWLLDLERIPPDATTVRLAFEHSPGTTWGAIIFVSCVALAFWAYRRTGLSRWSRSALAMARGAILVLACVLAAGPVLEVSRIHVEEDWIPVLVDRSASLVIEDAVRDGKRISRDRQLRDVLEDVDTWNEIEQHHHVHWMGFQAASWVLDQDPGTGSLLPGMPGGRSTDISRALEQALKHVSGRPIGGIIILSDGRTSRAPDANLLRQLSSRAVPVFCVPLGSPGPLGDLAIRRIHAPRRAFHGDTIPVTVDMEGLPVGEETGVRVTLVDMETGTVLDALSPGGSAGSSVILTGSPEHPGAARWKVVLDSDTPDLVPGNNERLVTIDIIDRPLRVLYVEGYPRWEYRYLKNLLVRERSIESSIMLLSADRDFAQEGNQPISRLPRTEAEFSDFDVFILGDIPARTFSSSQREQLRSQIAARGAGLIWIGGSRDTPSGWSGTVLADLLPMTGGLRLQHLVDPVYMQRTPLASQLGVLEFVTPDGVGWPEELVQPENGWPGLYGVQRIEPHTLKPSAERLAETLLPISGVTLPLVLQMQYGAGKTIYVATDEIWRWRYGRGELLPEQFWIQLVRMLGRQRVDAGDGAVVLEVNPRRTIVGQSIQVRLRIHDAHLAETGRSDVALRVDSASGRHVLDLVLRGAVGGGSLYQGSMLLDQPGSYRVHLQDPRFASYDIAQEVEVIEVNDELQNPETDHAMLVSISSGTGGQVIQVNDIAQLPGILPNRSIRTQDTIREQIWSTPLAFLLLTLLCTGEWIGRRVARLS